MINTFLDIAAHTPVIRDLLVVAFTVSVGVAFGKIKVKNIQLGIAGVLFAGLIVGHFGVTISEHTRLVLQDLGLVMFVFMMGLESGPGFLASLRQHGMIYNGLAVLIFIVSMALCALYIVTGWVPAEAAIGLFTGGLATNSGLGAAQSTMEMMQVAPQGKALLGMAHAIAFPFSILGAITAIFVLRVAMRVVMSQESRRYASWMDKSSEKWESKSLVVENPKLEGLQLKQLPFIKEHNVVVSRLSHNGEISVPKGSHEIHVGDVMHVVGTKQSLKNAALLIGSPSKLDLSTDNSVVSVRMMHVTSREWANKTIQEVRLTCLADVVIERVIRAGVDVPVQANLRLQTGDSIRVVGIDESLDKLAVTIGNTVSDLDSPQLTPIFLGVGLGLILGGLSIPIPGLLFPIKLGLAGGPLLVAMVLSKIGQVWKLSWYVPQGPNLYVREFGLALFLVCTGISGGANFFDLLLDGTGVVWIGFGLIMTMVPLIAAALVGRFILKMNFLSMCGVLAGAVTNVAVFGFANSQSKSGAVSLAYATVFPFAIILKLILAQLLVLIFI